MKYILSISLLVIYLAGTIQPSWILIDFYMNRDEITQKYCINLLDKGITTCRASCWLENVKKEKSRKSDKKFVVPEKSKTIEVINPVSFGQIKYESFFTKKVSFYQYHYDFTFFTVVFHPPKITLIS